VDQRIRRIRSYFEYLAYLADRKGFLDFAIIHFQSSFAALPFVLPRYFVFKVR
jgi:hypothetical protein